MMKLFRKIACLMVMLTAFGFALGMADSKASAEHFETLADTGYLKLSDDEKWEKNYDTALGELKFRYRKLAFSSAKNKYHMILWWDDKRIADGYCPENGYGYAFKIFRDEETSRVFIAIRSVDRVVLYGYDPTYKQLFEFVNSDNYYSIGKYPYIEEDDGQLTLGFLDSKGRESTKYELFWDKKANWFGYTEVPPQWNEQHAVPKVSADYKEPSGSIYTAEK